MFSIKKYLFISSFFVDDYYEMFDLFKRHTIKWLLMMNHYVKFYYNTRALLEIAKSFQI